MGKMYNLQTLSTYIENGSRKHCWEYIAYKRKVPLSLGKLHTGKHLKKKKTFDGRKKV